MRRWGCAGMVSVGLVTGLSGQAQWTETQRDDGAFEYRLESDEGAAIMFVCGAQGVVAGFEMPDPLDEPSRATLRSIPGPQENVAVSPVSDRVVSVVGGGNTIALGMVRDSARLFVRIGGQSITFVTAGSGHIVNGCLARQEALPPE